MVWRVFAANNMHRAQIIMPLVPEKTRQNTTTRIHPRWLECWLVSVSDWKRISSEYIVTCLERNCELTFDIDRTWTRTIKFWKVFFFFFLFKLGCVTVTMSLLFRKNFPAMHPWTLLAFFWLGLFAKITFARLAWTNIQTSVTRGMYYLIKFPARK